MTTNMRTGMGEVQANTLTPPTVLIADEREIVRRGLSDMINDDLMFECLTESAPSASDLLRLVADLGPEVIIASAGLSDLLPTLESIGGTPVILLVSGQQPNEGLHSLISAVSGVILESNLTMERLIGALESARRGQFVLDSELTSAILLENSSEADLGMIPLTARESVVLELMALGRSNKEIARELHISAHGAKRHVANIMMKLNCSNRTMAVVVAMAEGFVQADSQKIRESTYSSTAL